MVDAAQPTSVLDVTDATFQDEVLKQSFATPVVVDLWAPWCGPCRQLGPLLEQAVEATGGRVVLAKVNVDENPGIATQFQVQSIPAVYAVRDGAVVDGFVGAQGAAAVSQFIERLLPSESERVIEDLLEAGDQASLERALELDPGNERAVVALAELRVAAGDGEGALALLERIPESAETRRVAAQARTGAEAVDDGVEEKLDALLERVRDDEAARQEFLDVLELLGPGDPRTAAYRKKLTSRLF